MRLKTDKRFCCLGVLCDISPEIGTWHHFAKYGDIPCWGFGTDDDRSDLNFDLRQELRLSYNDMKTLMDMNDNDKKSFKEISQWIKENVE